MTKVLHPQPGLFVAVPLNRGGFGIALIARSVDICKRNVRIIYAYGFDRVFDSVPLLEVVQDLSISDACQVATCGDASIRNGRWPTIGIKHGFRAGNWPVAPEIQPATSPQYSMVPDPLVRRIQLVEGETLNCKIVENNGLIDPSDESQFPYAVGLGDSAVLEGSLDLAVRDHFRLHFVNIKPTTPDLWRAVNGKAIEQGMFPRPETWKSMLARSKTSRSKRTSKRTSK